MCDSGFEYSTRTMKSEDVRRIVNSRRALGSIRDSESLMRILRERDELPNSNIDNEKCEICGEESRTAADFHPVKLPAVNKRSGNTDCSLGSDRCDKSQVSHLLQYMSEHLKRREWIEIARRLPGITENIIDEVIYRNQDCPRNQPFECFSRWLEMPTFNLDLLFDSLVQNKRPDIVHNLHRLMQNTPY